MAGLLRNIEEQFILSINDRPDVRDSFVGFRLDEVETRYSANSKATRRVRELLISGGAGELAL